ncbi:hypothetical protein QOZ80_1BG0094190 [Eleusine coracana subsp. coracana]|nr:hypothetical protein QOZ80_1BG0094190 [Eleusine coracana subsp. coracana]
MPRAKIPMSLIGNTRARTSAFARRKAGLLKKADELSKLCDVPVAVVCAGGPDGGAPPVVWESREGVIERYRALPPEKREEHRHLNYVKAEFGKQKDKVARVRQGGPSALAKWSDALDGMALEEVLAVLGSIDAALLATAARRKELGLPEDDNADGDQLLGIAADGFDFEGMDGFDFEGEELVWDGVQPLATLNAEAMMPGVQYINGGSVGMGGNQNQFLQQQQMPGNGNNTNLSQFAWDAYQPNATAQAGYGNQFTTNGNYMDTQQCPQMQQVAGNVNAQQNDWLSLGMWGADESSRHAFAPGSSAYYMPTEHCAPCVGDNFTGAPGIAMGGNFVNANGNQYNTQGLSDEFQCPYTGQDFGLHYLSDVADGVQF